MKNLFTFIAAIFFAVTALAQPVLFDATWDDKADPIRKPATMPAELKPILWGQYAVHSHGTEKTNETIIRDFARACRDGRDGWGVWGGTKDLKPGVLVCLDFEVELTIGMLTHADCAKLFAAFHDESPGIRLTTYMGLPGISTIQEYAPGASNLAPETRARIVAAKKDWGPIVAQLDIIGASSYIIDDRDIEVSLTYIRNAPPVWHRYYPGKPVHAWVTGEITPFHGAGTKIDDATLERYIDALYAGKYEGVVVWGRYSQCDRLIDKLVKRQRPSIRPPVRSPMTP